MLLLVFVMLFVFVLYVFCFLDLFVVGRILVGIEYMLIPLLIKLCSHTHARTHTRARARVLPHTHVHTQRHTHTFSRIQTHTNTKHTVTTHSMKNNINNGEPIFFLKFSYRRRTYGRIVRHVLKYDRCVTVLGCRYTPTEINVIKLCTALVVCICFLGKRDAISRSNRQLTKHGMWGVR